MLSPGSEILKAGMVHNPHVGRTVQRHLNDLSRLDMIQIIMLMLHNAPPKITIRAAAAREPFNGLSAQTGRFCNAFLILILVFIGKVF
jgi:hypothetical protein